MSKPSYNISRWLFLRLLGLAYGAAFLSISGQILGLIGSKGILPAQSYLHISEQMGRNYNLFLPTLAWFNSSDNCLQLLCIGGSILALLVVLGICTGPALLLLWIFYLSIVNVGQDFLSFQWDILLLETGFLSIFLAPWRWFEAPWLSSKFKGESQTPSLIIIWLLRWLLFRLMFGSGLVKLASGDPTWANFTALNYHFFTQPLPTPWAWWAQQLPEWFKKIDVGVVFFIELIVPFLIFTTRKLRLVAAVLIIFLQIVIALTGNYAFFNLLTIALCLLLIDDQTFKKILTLALRVLPLDDQSLNKILSSIFVEQLAQVNSKPIQRWLAIALAVFIGVLSLLQCVSRSQLPIVAIKALVPIERFYFVNSYGLFAVMTTSRLEIQVEGSNDGEKWLPYQFKYKPQELTEAPHIVAPHQPRLDWQMWFAALSDWRGNIWFPNFMFRLLQGSSDVLSLLAKDPFKGKPPQYVRAELYKYSFTNLKERASLTDSGETDTWWKREYVGEYFPAASLRGNSP